MKQNLFFLFCLTASTFYPSIAVPAIYGADTNIQIVSIESDDVSYRLTGKIDNADDHTNILVLGKLVDSPGYLVARDFSGITTFPKLKALSSTQIWSVEVAYVGNISEFYAIAIERVENVWSFEQDIDALISLGIEESQSIESALNLLNNFGWSIDSYTISPTASDKIASQTVEGLDILYATGLYVTDLPTFDENGKFLSLMENVQNVEVAGQLIQGTAPRGLVKITLRGSDVWIRSIHLALSNPSIHLCPEGHISSDSQSLPGCSE